MIDYKDIDSFIEQNREALVRDIGRLVAVPASRVRRSRTLPSAKSRSAPLSSVCKSPQSLGLKHATLKTA